MNVLELNGTKYVKASSIARELGYTSDYVGQLCRSGKVNAQLVGRSWYVEDDSIRKHKNSRYRSTNAKTKQEITKIKNQSKTEGIVSAQKTTAFATKHFYSKLHLQEGVYLEDQSDLIPTLKEKEYSSDQKTPLEIQYEGAKSLQIKKRSDPYSMEASELPEIRFRGKLTIHDSGNITSDNSADATAQPHSKEGKKEKGNQQKTAHSKKRVRVVDSHPKSAPVSNRPLAEEIKNLSGSGEEGHSAERVVIQAVDTQGSVNHSYTTFIYTTSSLLLALLLSVGFFLVEQTIVTTTSPEEQTSTEYRFNFSSVIESIQP